MLIATIPALVAIAGALVYALAGNAKLAELGRLAFFAAILVLLLALEHSGAVRIP
jgi:hypothetical protein